MNFHTAERIGHVTSAQYAAFNGQNLADAWEGKSPRRGERDYVLSRSSLMGFLDNPKAWLCGYHDDDTKATDDGTLMDTLVLTPEQFPALYAVAPATYNKTMMKCPTCGSVTESASCRSNGCKGTTRLPFLLEKDWRRGEESCDKWEAEQVATGKTVITAKQLMEADAALAVLQQDGHISDLLACSERQIMYTALWHDEATGIDVPYKTLKDIVPRAGSQFDDSLADFKRSKSASNASWPYEIAAYNLDVQAWSYLQVHNAACPDSPRTYFLHVISENHGSYQVGRKELSDIDLQCGEGIFKQAMALYAFCVSNNFWPGHDDRISQEPADQRRKGWTVTKATTRRIEQAL